MSAPEAVFVSYRLGGSDGVAVEAAKWEWALHELGFRVRRVAGEFDNLRPDDVWLPFLAIDPAPGAEPDPGALGAALAGADLVVVENLCSLPLNLTAASITRDILADHSGRVCFHHHDFAWERPHLAHLDGFPPRRENSLHVTISEHARASLLARRIEAICIRNSFDFGTFPGDRAGMRSSLGFESSDIVLVQPTRAISRKNVGCGLQFAQEIAASDPQRAVRYWITGPAEDGYDAEFDALIESAAVPVHVGRAPRAADAYAAADLVVFPSTWEGFGNPVVEAVIARRMAALGTYPVLTEITDGLTCLSINRPDDANKWLRAPDADVLEQNYAAARARFSIEHLPDRLSAALAQVGWTDW